MNIRISGQQIDLGAALQDHVRERLAEVAGKYFDRPIEATVTFKRVAGEFKSEVLVHANSRTTVNASAESGDIYRAFDDALIRVAKRLRRHKRWLEGRRGSEALPPERPQAERDASSRHSLMSWDGEKNEEAPHEAVVVAELDTPIHDVTVADAVRMLDLGEEPVFVFRNAGTGAFNVVYRRVDGNVGWIES
jgi:ribosomal subunit interface protein